MTNTPIPGSRRSWLCGLMFAISGIAVAGEITVSTLAQGINASGGVVVGPDGNIYVGNYGDLLSNPNGADVFRITPEGKAEVFIIGFSGASGNAFDSTGNFYQSNISFGRVDRIAPDGTRTIFSSTGISGPIGIAIDSQDNVYVANCSTNTIRKITQAGVSTQHAASPLMNCPNGLTIDPDDNLYTANFGNGNVLKIAPDATVSLVGATPGSPFRTLGGNGHLTFANGVLYVASNATNQIYQLTLDGTLTVLAGDGTRGHADGPADQASFSFPNGISASADGRLLYLNESENTTGTNANTFPLTPNRVRVIELFEAPPEPMVDSSFSGSWYDPAHDGEGWLLEILADPGGASVKGGGLALAYWFTYPPPVESLFKGGGPAQAWLVGLGVINGNTISFDEVQIAEGGIFGAAFDPDTVIRSDWGRFEFVFDSCTGGAMSYESKLPEYGSGELALERVTQLVGLECAEAPAGNKGFDLGGPFSGSWFDSGHDGEGWLIEVLSDTLALVYWFTYDDLGNQVWFVGVGTIVGNRIEVDLLQAGGTVFGPGFVSGDVVLTPWGTAVFEFSDCNTGSMTYESKLATFGSGMLSMERITQIPGHDCMVEAVAPVKVRYLGNAGVWLSDGDNDVLIDALQRTTTGWILLPTAELNLLETGQPPYDSIELALITHNHGDHFSPASVQAFLAATPSAAFNGPQSGGLTNLPQHLNVSPDFGTSEVLTANGITVEVLRLRHFNQFGNDFSNDEHLAYLVHMGGKNFLHLGDVDYMAENLAPFNLAERGIDVAFIPTFNTLISAANRDVIMELVNPGAIVALHFQQLQLANESAQVLSLYPDAIIFDVPLEEAEF